MEKPRKTLIVVAAVICVVLIAGLLAYTTLWLGGITERDTRKVARATGRFYLEQLARRREKIVENYLKERIEVINVAIGLMQGEDLSDEPHLNAYQAKMKQLFKLDKFAFVDDEGLIYTSLGRQTNIDDYKFKYDSLDKPEISFFQQGAEEPQVIIAVPIVPAKPAFQNKTLRVCFMAIKMENMLSSIGLSGANKDEENVAHGGNAVKEHKESGGLNVIGRDTYCNIYTSDGKSLTKELLGGKATGEENLFVAMAKARFEEANYTYEQFTQDMQGGKEGVVSFAYEGAQATLAWVPV
ncbi:MAG: cache domain-containing protein, partial [Planctomycetes bacterium]|nr:cache domain-containing protein [Planctomycetota bacterium]